LPRQPLGLSPSRREERPWSSHGPQAHTESMTEAPASPATTDQVPSAAKAWIAIALSPIGVGVGIGTAYAVAAMIGVTLDPATPEQGRTFLQNTLCYGIATLVVLIAPVTAVALAIHPARAGSSSGRVAFVIGVALVLGAIALMAPSLLSW